MNAQEGHRAVAAIKRNRDGDIAGVGTTGRPSRPAGKREHTRHGRATVPSVPVTPFRVKMIAIQECSRFATARLKPIEMK